jgi:hypothetical protein
MFDNLRILKSLPEWLELSLEQQEEVESRINSFGALKLLLSKVTMNIELELQEYYKNNR